MAHIGMPSFAPDCGTMTHRFTSEGSYAGLLCKSTTSVETNRGGAVSRNRGRYPSQPSVRMTLPGSTESGTKGTKLAAEASTIWRIRAHLLERQRQSVLYPN